MRPQGGQESDLTGMLAKFIAQIDLVDSKQLNVTEQSVRLSCYASRDSVAKLLLTSSTVLKDRLVKIASDPTHNALLCNR